MRALTSTLAGLCLMLTLAPAARADPGVEPTQTNALASVTVVATPMSVGSALQVPLGGAGGSRPLGAIMSSTQVTITGEPGQLYRVGVTTPAGYRVSFLSASSGDVSASRIGRLGPQGRDTLRIAVKPAPRGEPAGPSPPALTLTISGE